MSMITIAKQCYLYTRHLDHWQWTINMELAKAVSSNQWIAITLSRDLQMVYDTVLFYICQWYSL